jgi:hypothetical protein
MLHRAAVDGRRLKLPLVLRYRVPRQHYLCRRLRLVGPVHLARRPGCAGRFLDGSFMPPDLYVFLARCGL